MNPHTGAIATFENDEDAKAAGHTVKITGKEAKQLIKLGGGNRKHRRTELAKMRSEERKKRKRKP